MPSRNDDLLDIPSIVPDSDYRSSGRSKPQPRPTPARSGNSTAPKHTGSMLFQAFILCSLAGLLIAGGYSYVLNGQQAALNQQLVARINTLESQLGIVSNPADQPENGETLGSKVKGLDQDIKTANDEIRKLWGVTNDKNKKQLESQSGQLAELQKNLGSMKNTVTELKKSMAVTEKSSGDANRSVAEIKTTIAQIGQNLSDMRTGIVNLQQRISQGDPVAREASQQAALVQEQAERLQSRLDSLEVQLGRHEDSLKGIDTFRRSVNSDLNKLKGTSGGYTSPPY